MDANQGKMVLVQRPAVDSVMLYTISTSISIAPEMPCGTRSPLRSELRTASASAITTISTTSRVVMVLVR